MSRSPHPGSSVPGPALLAQARRFHAAGQLREAFSAYTQLARQEPGNAGALSGLGQVHAAMGDIDRALEYTEQASAAAPRKAEYHIAVGALLQMQQRSEEAFAAAERALRLKPRLAEAHALIASIHERRNRLDDALAAADRALAIDGAHAAAAVTRATVLRRLRRPDDALAQLDRVLRSRTLPPSTRIDALHQRGRLLEGTGAYDDAWACFEEAGRLTAADPHAKAVDHDFWPRQIREATEGVTEASMARFSAEDLDDGLPAPIFMMGFSRSGTTLIEEILAAHPQVDTSSEAPLIRNVRRRLVKRTGTENTATGIATMTRADALALRQSFWEEAADLAGRPIDAPDRFFVHKQPLNTITLPLINALFPTSKVLFVSRDPRDVCVSCFQQVFTINSANVHFLSLEATVAFYVQVMTFWNHIRPMLRLDVMDLNYETLAHHFEATTRAFFAHCGIPWDDGVLQFHLTAAERAVSTPSYEAVAEPINTRAIGRWRRFDAQFAPYSDALAPFIPEFVAESGR